MVIVTLEDKTSYNIDTEDTFNARSIVSYKLRDRSDCRQIQSFQLIEGVCMDKNSKYYNSGNQFDGEELHCTNGWSYKWN